jgi:hypothetical protein
MVVQGTEVPLEVRRGDKLEMTVAYYDASEPPVLIDVTGWHASFVLWSAGDAVHTASDTNGQIEVADVFTLTVPGSATNDWPESGWYEFRVKGLDGEPVTLLEGSLKLGASQRDGAFLV